MLPGWMFELVTTMSITDNYSNLLCFSIFQLCFFPDLVIKRTTINHVHLTALLSLLTDSWKRRLLASAGQKEIKHKFGILNGE